MEDSPFRRPLAMWGGLAGFGIGAMVDTLFFHLIFQTHHLLSGFYDPYSYDGFRTNVMVDGLFLVSTGLVALVGIAMLWRTANGADRHLSGVHALGWAIVGAGVFNVFDGVVSHYVLDLHNVVHGTQAWNPHWIAVSAVLLAVGALVVSRTGPTTD